MSHLYKRNPDSSFTAVTLIGLPDVCEMLGIEYRAGQKRYQRGRLPEPVAVISGDRPVWTLDQIKRIAGESPIAKAS